MRMPSEAPAPPSPTTKLHMNRRRLGPVLLLFGLWLCPPLVVSLALVAVGLPEVLQSGLCPGAPPDIAAYPCSAYEYFMRMTLGPWALAGHLTLALAWTFVMACGLVLVILGRSFRSRHA